MKSSGLVNRSLFVLFLLIFTSALFAQQVNDRNYKPQVGQEGKDVVWVPTPQELVDKMLELAGVTSEDYVIDLGSGDGRTVISAAKLGARALGIEYNPDMVELSKRNAEKQGVGDKARFICADLFESDFSEATVVTMFLLKDINMRLRPRILDLKPGTRIVSNTFDMGEWEADQKVKLDKNRHTWNTALLWIVPAKIEGTWKMKNGELTFRQEFQVVYGSLTIGDNSYDISGGKLNGNEIIFTVNGEIYKGRVSGNKMKGTVTTGVNVSNWNASRGKS
ncbi:MAG: class I SAM-dependent methyltransferase [Bacteroidales bacterium]|nr:MAG: class I SAM-dependent methyltransferase [Bacteroidales bacterium]